jgi:hypothetical protein
VASPATEWAVHRAVAVPGRHPGAIRNPGGTARRPDPGTGDTVKKGRHRRYEEARALKRGSDLDIESIFSDLSEERGMSLDDEHEDDMDDLPEGGQGRD